MREIDQADIDHWHRHGYVIIKEFLTSAELKAAMGNLHMYLPTWHEYADAGSTF